MAVRTWVRTADARIWAALWVVYVVWGSTYFGIRVAVHPGHGASIPPLLLVGVRYSLAGLVMLAVSIRRPPADALPDPIGRRQFGAAAVVGIALLLGGNGLVSVAEQRVPSGVAALVVATVPIWSALLGAMWGHERISMRHGVGLVLGFAGVGALVVGTGSGRVDPVGVLVVVGAALSWAAGSVWSRTAPVARRPLVMTGMEMLCGGGASLLVGLAIGEGADLHVADISAQAWAALAYLICFGSLVAYTAYVWLLHNARLSLVTTYAFVNPLVAVLLGTVFLSEPFTVRTLIATVVIVSGVALIVTGRGTRGGSEEQPVDAESERVTEARPAECA